jgi:hypothetical protein
VGDLLLIKNAVRLVFCSLLLCLLWGAAAAQQPTSPSGADSSTPTQATTPQQNPTVEPAPQPNDSAPIEKTPPDKTKQKGEQKGTSNDRLFYALPNFLSMESVGKLPPLTTKEKFAVVTRGSFDYIQIPWYAFISGIGQADDSEGGFGQGWGAYGKRFATNFADGTIENYMTSAILPSILHQDPRFYQLGKGSFMHRAFYAVSRNFVTLGDSGSKEFNYSEIVGGALSAGISTYSYHPTSRYVSTPTNPNLFIPSDRTLKNTASVWGTQLGYDTMTIVVREFWPDIHRKLSKKKAEPAVSASANQ